ncbi:MAG TPA: hypothetical protein PLY93_03140 [Turneriella sp.]|nr:hypothetical protein [Turneriella sp.]
MPKDVHFTVQQGRVSFLCKEDTFFLRGTATRTLAWQRTDQIFATLAKELNATPIETWTTGKLYKVKNTKNTASDKMSGKELICAYVVRDTYALDVCANYKENETGNSSEKMIRRLISEFQTVAFEKMPLLQSAPLFSTRRVFTEENDTREPALLALTMPAGYVEVTRRENRSLFTDAAGLAEVEIFYEQSELALDSALAHKAYKKFITSFLTKQGIWHAVETKEDTTYKGAVCLLFTDNDKRSSNYCYIVAALNQNHKKKYFRVVFVAAFLRDVVDETVLLAEQKKLLQNWMATLVKHSG